MHNMPISRATRGALGEAVARARYAGERTTISVRGRPAAVLVSLEDAAALLEVARQPTGSVGARRSREQLAPPSPFVWFVERRWKLDAEQARKLEASLREAHPGVDLFGEAQRARRWEIAHPSEPNVNLVEWFKKLPPAPSPSKDPPAEGVD